MIIKTRLAFDTSLYRLTAPVDNCPFSALINDITEQWSLPKSEEYSLIWKEETRSEGQLIIDKEKEWQLFCRLHPAGQDDIIELQLISATFLAKLLSIAPTPVQNTQRSQVIEAPRPQESKASELSVAPKYAFHSVEPQPIKKRQTYQEQKQDMQTSLAPPPSSEVTRDAPVEEPMSAYERVMARSRMQGEGLNQFFGTVMARRAGHSRAEEEQPASDPTPPPEAATSAPATVQADTIVEDTEEASTPQRRPPRTKEEIAGTNDFLQNAWQERLKSMGHGSNSGSAYAKLRVGKGKQRQDDTAAEASTSLSQSRTTGANNSEEAHEALAPLQASLLVSTPGSLPDSRPGSRAASSSAMSISGGSAKTGFTRFLRKGQYNRQRQFASQPSSLCGSGTVTPSGSEIGIAGRRKRSWSFRSLSEALSREKRSARRSKGSERHLFIPQRDLEDVEDTPPEIPAPTSDTITEVTKDDIIEPPPSTPSKQREREIVRPTLLRASQSAPLTSTAVNLSPVGGITLHISSLGQPGFVQLDAEVDTEQYARRSNLFDNLLPKEIRLKCFESLVRLYDEEGDVSQDPSTAKENAVREFVRLSRVSKAWQSLLLDGQLWTSVDTTLLSDISNGTLLRIAQSAGPFIKKLDLQQAPRISSSLLTAMASLPPSEKEDQVSRFKSMMSVPSLANTKAIRLSSLTHLNLKGCRQISTKALHRILVRLPSVLHVNISNLDTVTNDTCLLLGACCLNLLSLDVSRCYNTSGKGIVQLIQAAQGALYDKAFFSPTMQSFDKQEDITLPLQELRAAGCADVDSEMMALIGNNLRSLQVLDLSYCSDLTDEHIKSLVDHPGPGEVPSPRATKTTYQLVASNEASTYGPYITLTPRQAGGDIQSDKAHYRHLLSSLRHICLSSCRRLTDRAGIYLAHAVPNLQYLELGNIGAGLRNEGLVALFKTTPLIQRIDLEGANEVTETVLEVITPDVAYVQSIGLERSRNKRRAVKKISQEASREESSALSNERSRSKRQRPPPPGAWLTHLILSSVQKPDADCLLDVVRRCPRLTYFQVDDTKANDSILKEFVALCRLREVKGAYLSLVDCRALSRNINADIMSLAAVRARDGRRGRQFQSLEYSSGSNLSGSNSHLSAGATINEYDDKLIVVKSFFNWEVRSQQRRIQQRRNQRAASMAAGGIGSGGGSVTNRFLTRARRDSIGAALSLLGVDQDEQGGEGLGRWNRITNGFLGQGDEGEDARGCSVM